MNFIFGRIIIDFNQKHLYNFQGKNILNEFIGVP